jgi:hypothetical protein
MHSKSCEIHSEGPIFKLFVRFVLLRISILFFEALAQKALLQIDLCLRRTNKFWNMKKLNRTASNG